MTNKVKLDEKTIVFFDGECVICNGFFHFLLKRDIHKRLSFATLQSTATLSFIELNYKGEVIPDSLLLWYKQNMYTKSDAALYAIASLGSAWKLVKSLFIFPKFLRNIVYDFIAKNRYKWWKKKECLIPGPNWKERFIDN